MTCRLFVVSRFDRDDRARRSIGKPATSGLKCKGEERRRDRRSSGFGVLRVRVTSSRKFNPVVVNCRISVGVFSIQWQRFDVRSSRVAFSARGKRYCDAVRVTLGDGRRSCLRFSRPRFSFGPFDYRTIGALTTRRVRRSRVIGPRGLRVVRLSHTVWRHFRSLLCSRTIGNSSVKESERGCVEAIPGECERGARERRERAGIREKHTQLSYRSDSNRGREERRPGKKTCRGC